MKLQVRCAFLLIIVFGIIPFLAHADGVFVIMSQNSEANNAALKSFSETIGSSEHISTYDLSEKSAEPSIKLSKRIRESNPDIVLAIGTPAALVAKEWVKDKPIVFCMVLNPIASELVNSVRAPGGNITGVSLDIPPKVYFKCIKAVVTEAKSIGVIYNPNETGTLVQEASEVANRMGLTLVAKPVLSECEVPGALKTLLNEVDVLWSVPDKTVFASQQSTQYILLSTLKAGKPFVGLSDSFVRAGALMALSCDYADIGKQSAEIVNKVKSGKNPGSIPVSAPRKVFLSINLKTADQIDLHIPEHVIKSANNVIK